MAKLVGFNLSSFPFLHHVPKKGPRVCKPIIYLKSCSKFMSRDSFEICRKSAFQCTPWNLILTINWLRNLIWKDLRVYSSLIRSWNNQLSLWYLVTLTSSFSVNLWSKLDFRGCIEKLSSCRFQNCPWTWILSKIWGRY